ncbi:deoxyguanosinetriphosphate triphosphohydrolase family protein [Dendrosporobacter sp. 1207_IL3150]|uniref:deoxyguanosinetriphosphate triphosphohydrolase family protein n=1 Tax=Dendrosporobacter sp. 1207_IL3150 TaxID=3084054 RepID=UPI003FA5D437
MKVLIWKYKIGEFSFSKIEEYFSEDKTYTYHTKENEREMVSHLFEKSQLGFITIIVVGYDPQNGTIKKAWIGKASSEEYTFKLKINAYKKLSDHEIAELKNLYEASTLSGTRHTLENTPSYFFIKQLPKKELFDIVFELMSSRFKERINEIYKVNDEIKDQKAEYSYSVEANLHDLAQKSAYCIRPLNMISAHPFRNEFQRDKERIIHSKAFRRIVDKAQIYDTSKGDHYRKRLTHSLEVSQIARAIARQLNLNEDLTEAIAIGHDVGHTPFGHEGERQLDLILSGKVKLTDNHEPENLGGFKHNYQGVRLLNYLEEKYIEYEGLNISYQVLEGMLKHTGIKKHKGEKRTCKQCLTKCFNIDEFLIVGDPKYLHLEYDFCTTLEGQIVDLADEIAQRGHDLDDGIASGVFTIDDLIKELEIKSIEDPRFKEITELVKKSITNIENIKRDIIDQADLKRAVVTPAILGYFMKRLTTEALANMNTYIKENPTFSSNPVINKRVINFNDNDKFVIEKIEEIIKTRIINSQEVNCFDGKSAYIVRKLFKAYYSNPRQLPDNTIRRINKQLNVLGINYTDIRKGKKDDVEEEIKVLQGTASSGNEANDFLKHSIFMRNIADLIGGMTDEFAKSQFQNLYIS